MQIETKTLPVVLHKIVKEQSSDLYDLNVDIFELIVEATVASLNNTSYRSFDLSKEIILTFDDCNFSDYEIAFPMLSDKGLTAYFFIVTDWVGKNEFLSKPAIVEMHRNGMLIGSHSRSHRDLVKASPGLVKSEMQYSKYFLEDAVGSEVVACSIPYGRYTRQVVETCLDVGYQYVFTSDHGIWTQGGGRVPRNSIHGLMSELRVLRLLRANQWSQIGWHMESLSRKIAKTILNQKKYDELKEFLYGLRR